MKKIGLSVLVVSLILLMAIPLFAQSPRQPTSSEGKTSFTNIAIRGLNVSGVPGYIEIADTDGDIYYLWVDTDGNLMIASEIAVGYGASPATTSWASGQLGVGGPVGIVVVDQAR